MPLESTDSKFLYYTKGSADAPFSEETVGLWRMAVDSGQENRVASGVSEFFWTTAQAGIYFVDLTVKPKLKFIDPASNRIETVTTLQNQPFCCNPAVSVSSDGRNILYNQLDNSAVDIMLVDNFR